MDRCETQSYPIITFLFNCTNFENLEHKILALCSANSAPNKSDINLNIKTLRTKFFKVIDLQNLTYLTV